MQQVTVIGWGDMEPQDIARLRKALRIILGIGQTHLDGIPKEFTDAEPTEPETSEDDSPVDDDKSGD